MSAETTRTPSRLARICAGLVATAFVFGPAALHLAGAEPAAMENREPAPAPAATDGWDALDAVGPWAADRLPGRSPALRANAWIDYHLLGELPLVRPDLAAAGTDRGAVSRPGPSVIRGADGYLFLHQEFRSACALGAGFGPAQRSMLRLAEIIEASGRDVVFTVAPNKSSVLTRHLPRRLPTGRCATLGLARQLKAMDTVSHPLALNIRTRLARAPATGRQPFWRNDTHWTSAGAALYAQAVAERLDPRLAGTLQVRPGVQHRVGDLTRMIGLSTRETAQAATVSTGGKVRPEPGFEQYHPDEVRYRAQRWTTRPAGGLIQGETLLIGDSFMYHALGTMRPLFANGMFLWTSAMSKTDIIAAMARADTVVIEVVERSVSSQHPFARPDFQADVAAALKVNGGR